MPETAGDRLRCGRACSGRQQQTETQSEKGESSEEPHPPSPPLLRDSLSPRTSGSECWSDVEGRRHPQLGPGLSQVNQHRPSVLRQGTQAGFLAAPRPQHEQGSSQPISLCKAEVDTSHHRQSSPPQSGPSPRHTHHALPQRRAGPKQSSVVAGRHDSVGLQTPGGTSALYVSGLCRWPGCDAAFEDFPSFLKHLHCEHIQGDKSIAQWRVQQDMVQYMESQLTLEKQKLFAMQLHLHFSEHKSTELRLSSDWSYSTALFLPRPRAAEGDAVPRCATKDPEELAQHGYWPAGTAHLLPDLVPSIECYKYNNIRPPYTYACLIRWSILESADKQRSLNEIYNWFTTMFFYFRHNTATWKNAVRHNLSLHKCFVRVEGGKGAVWTVDDAEYQRRKGQKYYRDHPMKWLTPYAPHFRPEEP